jgi:glycine cleavage system H protein
MNFPTACKYSKNDEWVLPEGKTAKIGITDYAQDALSDIVFLEYLVGEGDQVSAGDTLGTIESVKAASDIYFPVGGKVLEVNEALLDSPEKVNTDPYGEAWMIKIEVADSAEVDTLMDAKAYEADVQKRE